jgi:histidinol-phosphatase (PHP family)
MIEYDCHIHTNYSDDGRASMEEVVLRAAELGLRGVTITDHVDFTYPDADFLYAFDFDSYYNEYLNLREKYAGTVDLLIGLEIGVGPRAGAAVDKIMSAYPLDFVIGSVHDVEGRELHKPEAMAGLDKRAAYEKYLVYLLDSLKAVQAVRVAGHLDFVSRYGPFADPSLKYGDFAGAIDDILKLLIDSGRGLEINTSGYRYGIDNPYPQPEILRRYKRLGGEIVTVGSDAHYARDIGKDFDKAADILKAACFGSIAVYRGMTPEFISIGRSQ